MSRWRIVVVLTLLAAPVVFLVGVGGYYLWDRGLSFYVWWPMAANPNYYKPVQTSQIYDVTFVGANYGVRQRYIGMLLQNKVDLHAFGSGELDYFPGAG